MRVRANVAVVLFGAALLAWRSSRAFTPLVRSADGRVVPNSVASLEKNTNRRGGPVDSRKGTQPPQSGALVSAWRTRHAGDVPRARVSAGARRLIHGGALGSPGGWQVVFQADSGRESLGFKSARRHPRAGPYSPRSLRAVAHLSSRTLVGLFARPDRRGAPSRAVRGIHRGRPGRRRQSSAQAPTRIRGARGPRSRRSGSVGGDRPRSRITGKVPVPVRQSSPGRRAGGRSSKSGSALRSTASGTP